MLEECRQNRPEDSLQPAVDWLLTHPSPAVRLRTREWLLGGDPGAGLACEGRPDLSSDPVIVGLLEKQADDGSWGGTGFYGPRHRSTFYVLSVLAEMGASVSCPPPLGPAVERAAVFSFAFQAANGEFYQYRRAEGGKPSSLAPVPCVTIRAATFLAALGYADDPRVGRAVEYLVSIQRPDGSWSCAGGAMPRRYVSEKGCLGTAACFLALAEQVPHLLGGHPSTRAAAQFTERLYMRDPKGFHVPDKWRALPYPYYHFPMDLAETGRLLLAELGPTERVEEGVRLCLAKCRPGDGLWASEGRPSKPPVPPGRKGRPHPWVTLRVLRFILAHARVRCS